MVVYLRINMKPLCHPSAADAVLEALAAIVDDYHERVTFCNDADPLIIAAEAAIASARRPSIGAQMLLWDPYISEWLMHAISEQLNRDPIDAVRDAELLLGAIKLRLVEAQAKNAPDTATECAAVQAEADRFDQHGRIHDLRCGAGTGAGFHRNRDESRVF